MADLPMPSAWSGARLASLLGAGLKFGGIQLATQLLGFASGLILVRSMAPQEYAYYTIALSIQGAMAVLSDSGISGGVLALGGKVWQQPGALQRLVRAAVDVRLRFGAIAFSAASVALVAMLTEHGAPAATIAMLAVLVVTAAAFQLSSAVYGAVPKLLLKHQVVLNVDLKVSGLRMALIVVAAFTHLDAAIALAIAAVVSWMSHAVLRAWVERHVGPRTAPDPEFRTRLYAIARPQIALALYYCLQSQITIWLVTGFGSVQSVAEVGALGRFVAFFTLLSVLTSYVLLPRLARAHTGRAILRHMSFIVLLHVAAGSPLILLAAWSPESLLWLLGPSYGHLERELFWMCTNMAMNALAGILWTMNAARGWTRGAWLLIAATVASQAVLATLLELDTVTGVLWLNQMSLVPGLFINVGMAWLGYRRERQASWRETVRPAATPTQE